MAALCISDEKELILLLKTGDRKAFALLYHAYKQRIYLNLRKLLHSDSLAEEYLQEVFFKLWEKHEQLDPDKPFSAYLFRIGANMVYDHFRKAALDQKLAAHLITSGTELYDHIDALVNYKESHDQLELAIAALPPQRQKIFRLCKIEGKSYAEVGTLLGVSTATINDHIVKATRMIREQFISSHETAVIFIAACLFLHDK